MDPVSSRRRTLLLLLLLATLAGAGAWWHRELIYGPDLDTIGGGQRHRILLSNVSPRQVHSVWKPVLLFRNGEFHGCGTLVSPGGKKPFVVASRHQFPDGFEGYCTYQVVRPFDPTRHPISHVAPLDERRDLVICRPGEPTLLLGVDSGYYDPLMRNGRYPVNSGPLRSLMSDREHQGAEFTEDPMAKRSDVLRILGRRIVGPGESGSGFVTADGDLFVLTRGGPLEADAVEYYEHYNIRPPASADTEDTGYRISRSELEAVDTESAAWLRRAEFYQSYVRAQRELARAVPSIDLPDDLDRLRSDPRLQAVPGLHARLRGLETTGREEFGLGLRRGQRCSRAIARYQMAVGRFIEADRIFQDLLDHNPHSNAPVHVEYGLSLLAQDFSRVAGVQFGYARKIHEERYGGDPALGLLDAWREAAAHSAAGDHEASLKASRRAEAWLKEERDTGIAALARLANRFHDLERESRAIVLWEEIVRTERGAEALPAAEGTDTRHPGSTPELMRTVAAVLREKGHPIEAAGVHGRLARWLRLNAPEGSAAAVDEATQEVLRQGPEVWPSLSVCRLAAASIRRIGPGQGDEGPFLDSVEMIAGRLASADHVGEAEAMWRRQIELLAEVPGAGDEEADDRLIRAVTELAELLSDSGRPEEALALVAGHLPEGRAGRESPGSDAGRLLLARARAERAAGERAAAEADLYAALRILESEDREGDPIGPARVHNQIALLREDERRVTDAMKHLEVVMTQLRLAGLKSDSLPVIETRQRLAQLAQRGETLPPPLGVPEPVYSG